MFSNIFKLLICIQFISYIQFYLFFICCLIKLNLFIYLCDVRKNLLFMLLSLKCKEATVIKILSFVHVNYSLLYHVMWMMWKINFNILFVFSSLIYIYIMSQMKKWICIYTYIALWNISYSKLLMKYYFSSVFVFNILFYLHYFIIYYLFVLCLFR